MKKRLVSLLMALALCLSLLPATALAAAPNGQVIYVGNVNVTSGGYWTTGNDGTVTAFTGEGTPADNFIHYDATNNVLTLHNAVIKKGLDYSESIQGGTYIPGSAIAVFHQNGAAELTIQLEGTNTIAEVSAGIYVLAPSNSTGDASLTITGNGSLNASASQRGIMVQSNSSDAALKIENAKVTATASSFFDGVGVQSKNDSSVSLTVDGGSLTATGGGNYGAGIQLQFGSGVSGSGTPTVTVSNNAIVRASGNAGGIATNATAATPSGTGIVFDNGAGTVYGSVTLQEDLTINEGESLTIPDGASLNTGSHEVIVNGGTLTGGDKITGTVKYAPAITTESLPNGTVNEEYSQTLAATGSDTITWSLADGSSLPAGLNLDENTGKIYGTPITAEKSTFTVTATNAYGSASREFTLTISAPTTIPVTGVLLDQNALTLTEGDTVQLTATVEPANATNKGVTWKSSDTSIATVSEDGTVTAISAGTVTITATAKDGSGVSASCSVTVTHGNMAHTPKKDATCTVDGTEEYWTCGICGKHFKDESGTIPTTPEENVIPAAGHKLTKTEAQAPTCTEKGNTEYWTCGTCGKYFSDGEGKEEITLDSTVLSALGHDYKDGVCTRCDGKDPDYVPPTEPDAPAQTGEAPLLPALAVLMILSAAALLWTGRKRQQF